MRSYSPAETVYLQTRAGLVAKALLWVYARNRTTGATEAMGLWTGDQDQVFAIGGVNRTYLGAGGLLGIDAIVMQTGLVVQQQRVVLATVPAEVLQMIQTYDVGLARCEIHRAFFDPQWGSLIAEPRRIWKGFVDKAPRPTAAVGGDSSAELTLVSSARALSKGLTLTKSDAIQSQRSGDRIRRYAEVSGKVSVAWGELRATAPVAAAPVLVDTSNPKRGR